VQRRHQKVIEEAPSPAVTARLRARLGAAAIELAKAAGYTNAGTAEFLLADGGEFYFLELNARLQVEHPVTELVTGRDLVADQLRIAVGEPLGFTQSEVTLTGHAVEARLYAEDPWHEFVPATGEVLEVRWPSGDGIRIDRGIASGDVVGTRYDPLLAKLVGFGTDRVAALATLGDVLKSTSVLGVTTNRGFLEWLVDDPGIRKGSMWTTFIDEHWPEIAAKAPAIPTQAWSAAAAALPSGFRLNARPVVRITIDDETRSVAVPYTHSEIPWTRAGDSSIVLDVSGRSMRAALASPPTVEAAVRGAAHEGAGAQLIKAPMPGTVIAVRVGEGDVVEAGQVLIVLEAMKMENTVPAPAAGRVAKLLVEAGRQVQRGDTLVELD
jgi:acetyl/propionyl-CoA carboxylase alpha subunit